jgi:flagellar hook assembly protein FlgD
VSIGIPVRPDAAAAGLRIAQGLSQVKSAATSATSSASASPITSSDFLKLLVTEMKNQDPTQTTDPNAYIQQLVGVNSLQQLISINQELGTTPTAASPALSDIGGIS